MHQSLEPASNRPNWSIACEHGMYTRTHMHTHMHMHVRTHTYVCIHTHRRKGHESRQAGGQEVCRTGMLQTDMFAPEPPTGWLHGTIGPLLRAGMLWLKLRGPSAGMLLPDQGPA